MKINQTNLALALAGDASAAAGVIASVWPDAYRIAWSILRDSSAAEDAAQDSCARAWSALATLRRCESFPVWFYRIVVNECNRKKRVAYRDARLIERLPPRRESSQEERVDLREAVDRLAPHLRLTIVLRYYYDLNNAEIASVVSVSPITVRWRLMMAHRRIREMLSERSPAPHKEKDSKGRYEDEQIAVN